MSLSLEKTLNSRIIEIEAVTVQGQLSTDRCHKKTQRSIIVHVAKKDKSISGMRSRSTMSNVAGSKVR